MILYFVDNMIELIYQKKVIRIVLKESVNKGRIISREKFMLDFASILKREKIKSKLFGEKIKIVKESFYTIQDIFYLERLFEDLGFVKVEWIDIYTLFKKNGTYVEMNNEYIVIHEKKAIYLDIEIFKVPFSNFEFKDSLYFFGKSSDIIDFCKNKKNCYCFDNYENFISDALLKV